MAKVAKKVANDNKKAKNKASKKTISKAAKTSKKLVKKQITKAVKKPAPKKLAAKKPVAKKPLAKITKLKVAAKKPAQKQVLKPVAKAPTKSTVANIAPQKAATKNPYEFNVGHHLVYPTHGVGKVIAIETQEIAGTKVTLYVLNFEKEKMTLRVPVTRAAAVGLRRLSSSEQISRALGVLKGKPKTARGMWSRRATEYGQKINSGNIEFIAQVVRDLHKNVDDPDRSYSERVIYESAFSRLAGEYAAINKIDPKQAEEILNSTLKKKAA